MIHIIWLISYDSYDLAKFSLSAGGHLIWCICRVISYVQKFHFSMERLKIEEIANNYGMHLKNFAQRKVLADQINFALDFGMEYYQGCFQFLPISRLEIISMTLHHWLLLKSSWKPKKSSFSMNKYPKSTRKSKTLNMSWIWPPEKLSQNR